MHKALGGNLEKQYGINTHRNIILCYKPAAVQNPQPVPLN